MLSRTVTCPSCHSTMEIRDRHGVEIDLCPRCRGVWLDKGELDQLLERSGRFLEVPGEDPDIRHAGRHREDFFKDKFEWF
jgi:Zn-finger nucleic acid-binding protein